jgi:predicted nucleic acid-binding protein
MITICDTGPLVALLSDRDPHHAWACGLVKRFQVPLLTCEPALAEAFYLVRVHDLDVDPLFAMLDRGFIRVDFSVAHSWPRMRTLMGRYPQMDFADAAVVVMSEQHKRCQVWTVDRRDFTVYRRNDRQVIPFIAPPK